MKILFVTLFYPPAHFGGTETYTHGLAKGLQQRGHSVQVLCAENWGKGKSYWNGATDDLYEDVPVRRLHLNWTKAPDVNSYLFYNPLVEELVNEYLTEWKPEIVHVTSCQTLSASVIAAAKQAGLPVVVSLTDFWFMCPRVTLMRGNGDMCDGQVEAWECIRCLMQGSKMDRWSKALLPESVNPPILLELSRQSWLTQLPGLRGMALDINHRRRVLHDALELADRLLIASEAARNLFQGAGFSMPIEIVPYGHDLGWLGAYSGKTRSDEIRFAFVGQLGLMKGPQLLIEAYRAMNSRRPTRLLMYGDLQKDPEFTQHLSALARDRGDIEFRGTYPHNESARIFSEIDVLVVPSLWYDYPLIINEAFATGTPVIASDLGGMRELVTHRRNGLLFQRGNIQDLTRQLESIANEEGMVTELQGGIPQVRRMGDAVAEMLAIYESMSIVSPSRIRQEHYQVSQAGRVNSVR